MRMISIVGQKNSGKTTLLVALAREFRRQGKRVATIKHATHPATVDKEGTDSYRHFYEGSAEHTLVASPDIRILFERAPDEVGPVDLARRFFSDAELVLVEGFRAAPLPKVEVYRKDLGLPTLFDATRPNADEWVAIITDDTTLRTGCRVLRFQDTMWLPVLTTLAWERARVVDS